MKINLRYFYKLAVLVILFLSGKGWGQVLMPTTGSYSQNFDALPSSGTTIWSDNSTIANIYAQRKISGNFNIVPGAGTSNTGNLYSFGIGSETDRSLGSVGSSSTGDISYGVLLQNTSSFTITDIKISYSGEQWRNSAAAAQTVTFYYKISATLINDLQPNVNTSWIAVPALDFISPITGGTAGALDGNAPADRVIKTNISIPSLNLPDGSYIMLKWDDPDHTGSDHGLSIDDVKIDWTVNSIKPEPSDSPSNFICGATTNSSIPLTWIDATGTTPPDGYLIKWSSTSYAAISDPMDGTAETNSANTQNVVQGTQNFTPTGLAVSTPYYFKIFSYTNSGSAINYKITGPPQTTCTTTAPPCNFLEDFSGIGNSASYGTVSWSGIDANGGNGGAWSATDAREDQSVTGKAITIRTGTLTSPTFPNGVSSLSFKTRFPFNETSGNLLIKVNGMTVGTILFSEIPSDRSVITKSLINLNIPGPITITLESAGARYAVDDLQWTCFTGTPEPNINIQGNGTSIVNGDTTPSTTDDTDFGSSIISGTDVEKTFTVQNNGAADLTLNNPAVVLLDGTKGFTVSAQPAASTMSGFTSQTFKIKFNKTVAGTYTETVKIGSNDPDTPVYTFDVRATVLQPTISVTPGNLSGFTYALGQGPSAIQSFKPSGTNLSGAVTVSAPADGNWEISTNQTFDGTNSAPWQTLPLPKTASNSINASTNISVRLRSGLSTGNYSGVIMLTSPGANAISVGVSGSVTAGIPDMKVTGNGISISNGSPNPNAFNNTLFTTQNIGNSQTKSFGITNLGGDPLTVGTISISGADATSFSVLNGPAVGTVLSQDQTVTFDIKFTPASIGTKNAAVSISNNDPNDNPYTFAVRGGATYCSSPGEIILARQDFEISPGTPTLNYTLANFGSTVPGSNTGFSTGASDSGSLPKNNNLFSEGSRAYRIQGNDPASQITSGVSFTFDSVDTSVYTNTSLSFRVAGFSLGSTGNGMDDLDAASVSTAVNADKLDYVLVEISPDNGATWFQQAKVVSGQLNLPWSFGSAGTVAGTRAYTADNNLTYFNSTSAAKYSAVSVTNLPAVSNLKVRISAQDNAINESWIIDDVRITSTGLVPKVWNGTAWLPSAPLPSDKAILNADYSTSALGGITVCQCDISSGATLTVGADTEVKVSDVFTNNGKLIIQPRGNFIQVNDVDSNSGTGIFQAEQKVVLSPGRNQYNYIISPAEPFNMKDLFKNSFDVNGLPVTSPFVLYHDESTNKFYNSSGAYIKGRALAVKEPGSGFVDTQITAVFSGKPTNGLFTYQLVNSNVTDPKRGYNLIGNPYPSNMDLVKFYQQNSLTGNLDPTFYIWDQNANMQTQQAGDTYRGQAYAQFNAATPVGVGTATKATGDPLTSVLKIPTRSVAVGQGFMAKLNKVSSEYLTFSNSVRSSDASQAFFGKTETAPSGQAVDRYWINMISPDHIACNIAVVYSQEGVDGFTKEDSPSMGGSDAVYSLVEGEKVSINGKGNFRISDAVLLGSVHAVAGNYRILLDRTEGIFANGQHVYLKDHQTGTVTDLSESTYGFNADAGETSGRFEVVYVPGTILETGEMRNEPVTVYRDGSYFTVRSTGDEISEVELFDISGRMLWQCSPKSREVHISAGIMTDGLYLLKLKSANRITVKKIRK